jgi:hypothetical protein
MDESMSSRGLVPIGPEECLQLLRSHTVGRVVYTDNALPAITPVTYAMDGHHIYFRTAEGSRLAAATRDAVVAFEVDDIDRSMRCGWSVVVTGVASDVVGSALVRASQLQLVPWVDGERYHYVRITPGVLTGRRVRPVTVPVARASA